jgi:mannose-6-phosphate isomerase-like protein (cupin superfamily)
MESSEPERQQPEPQEPKLREPKHRELDRREFAGLLPALFAAGALLPAVTALLPEAASAQQSGTMDHPVMGEPTPGPAGGRKGPLQELVSGVYTPGPAQGSPAQRVSHQYLAGILKAGNIQMAIHETIQPAGAVHEPIGKHLHSEIWLVREGVCELTTNGVTRRMIAGDVGLCCAGDLHYVRNAGDTQCTYFVVTVGPPEQTV